MTFTSKADGSDHAELNFKRSTVLMKGTMFFYAPPRWRRTLPQGPYGLSESV